MTRLEFINRANGIADKRTLRLLTLEAVAAELGEKYGACCEPDQDEYQASIWGWVAAECRASREAIEEIAEMVKEVGDDAA